jgi:hemerythrin-like domain-containing protein
MEVKKPIKRNAAMVEFSKDHHFTLLLVWKIRQGLRKSIEAARISRYVVHFFDTDLIHHFKDEEEVLFNKLPTNNPLRIQAETEHKNIKQVIDQLRKNEEDSNLLKNFADILEKHIRFEERELFDHLQQNLTEDTLAEMVLSAKSRNHEPVTAWKDVFWEDKTKG